MSPVFSFISYKTNGLIHLHLINLYASTILLTNTNILVPRFPMPGWKKGFQAFPGKTHHSAAEHWSENCQLSILLRGGPNGALQLAAVERYLLLNLRRPVWLRIGRWTRRKNRLKDKFSHPAAAVSKEYGSLILLFRGKICIDAVTHTAPSESQSRARGDCRRPGAPAARPRLQFSEELIWGSPSCCLADPKIYGLSFRTNSERWMPPLATRRKFKVRDRLNLTPPVTGSPRWERDENFMYSASETLLEIFTGSGSEKCNILVPPNAPIFVSLARKEENETRIRWKRRKVLI